jgi:hypothetical protein
MLKKIKNFVTGFFATVGLILGAIGGLIAITWPLWLAIACIVFIVS